MNAYINGFVKRASEYGFSQNEALAILKQASPETVALSPGARTAVQAGKGNGGLFPGGARTMTPAQLKALRLPTPLPLDINPAHANDLGRFTR